MDIIESCSCFCASCVVGEQLPWAGRLGRRKRQAAAVVLRFGAIFFPPDVYSSVCFDGVDTIIPMFGASVVLLAILPVSAEENVGDASSLVGEAWAFRCCVFFSCLFRVTYARLPILFRHTHLRTHFSPPRSNVMQVAIPSS